MVRGALRAAMNLEQSCRCGWLPKLRAAANATLLTTPSVDNRLRMQRAMKIVLMQRRGNCDAVPRLRAS
jgi:hypothetical protein